jgi:hypothetical protein
MRQHRDTTSILKMKSSMSAGLLDAAELPVRISDRADSFRNSRMATFSELVDSRKQWIEQTLQPWCRQAPRAALIQADDEWLDIAGRADSQATLWTWAWSRFPALVHDGLSGVDETREVTVVLTDGRDFTGFPDGRTGKRGELILVSFDPAGPGQATQHGPFSIDEIRDVRPADPTDAP